MQGARFNFQPHTDFLGGFLMQNKQARLSAASQRPLLYADVSSPGGSEAVRLLQEHRVFFYTIPTSAMIPQLNHNGTRYIGIEEIRGYTIQLPSQ